MKNRGKIIFSVVGVIVSLALLIASTILAENKIINPTSAIILISVSAIIVLVAIFYAAKNAVEDRHFDRFVVDKCSIQGGIVNQADGTITNIVNATTIITKDVEHYKSPLDYANLPVDLREKYYTVQIGDFVVFAEVDDIVTTASEFLQLQNKYKNNGIKVTSVSPNIFGTRTDNVTITNT